jgi:hypothetical protein
MNSDDSKDLHDRLIKEEDQRVMYLQGLVDTAILKIMNAKLRRQEALDLVLRVRGIASELFPDNMGTFDLIFMARFKRAIDEYTLPDDEEGPK